MTVKEFFKARIYFTAIITIAVWAHLAWDYFHGGVPSHHFLQRKDMPELSNWLGGFLLPLLTWFLLYRVKNRVLKESETSSFPADMGYAFLGALSFGVLLSVFFTLGYKDLPFYMIIGLLVSALFFPIYRAECFLGFVVGMSFTFGGVLPIIIISVFSIIGTMQYLVVRRGVLYVFNKIADLKNTRIN